MISVNFMLPLTVLLGAVAISVAGHTWHTGRQCPDIEPYPNLSLDKVLGVWYVVYQFDTSNTCMVWNITKLDDVSYKVTEARQLSVLDALSIDHKHQVTASLDLPNPEVPARMRVRWPTSVTGKADFVIFDTDYQDYMAVFECDRAGLLHRRSVTVLSRTSVMDQMFVDRIRRKLDTAGIAHDALNIIDHNICREKGRFSWHTDGEFFGLLGSDSKSQDQVLRSGIEEYDISQLEILEDGVVQDGGFKGSLRKPKSV